MHNMAIFHCTTQYVTSQNINRATPTHIIFQLLMLRKFVTTKSSACSLFYVKFSLICILHFHFIYTQNNFLTNNCNNIFVILIIWLSHYTTKYNITSLVCVLYFMHVFLYRTYLYYFIFDFCCTSTKPAYDDA